MTLEHSKSGVPPLAGEGMRENIEQQHCTTHHEHPLDRVLDAIRAQGGRVKQSGGQWMCTCPAHNDRTPSLSIKQGEDGRVLLHCHGGCRVDTVVGALELEIRDLFPAGSTATVSSRTHRPEKPRSSIDSAVVASMNDGFEELSGAMNVYTRSMGVPDHQWDYHDARGNIVGVVLRWNTFVEGNPGKKIRPISLIDGKWHLSGIPNPRPLYRLPQILASKGTIFVWLVRLTGALYKVVT